VGCLEIKVPLPSEEGTTGKVLVQHIKDSHGQILALDLGQKSIERCCHFARKTQRRRTSFINDDSSSNDFYPTAKAMIWP